MAGVDENSRIAPFMVKAYDDTFTNRLNKLADQVHSLGSALVVQIAHCGAKVTKTDSGQSPLGISSLPEQNNQRNEW